MRPHFAVAAILCLTTSALFAQIMTGSNASGSLTSGKSPAGSASKNNIVNMATSSSPKGTTVSAGSGKTVTSPFGTTTSPFGTTSSRTKNTSRRWKTTSKIADCIREKSVPANTNFSFSGTITRISNNGHYVVLTMFDSIETDAENGARGDVPVTITVVMDTEAAANAKLKENSRKSFTVDSNYVYFVWNDVGCNVRAVDNSLTDPDQTPTGTKR